MTTKLQINIHINGFKDGFKSKNALDKFKAAVKTHLCNNTTNNYQTLAEHYLKEEFSIKLVESSETELKFEVIKKVTVDEVLRKNNIKQRQDVLKHELKARRLARANKEAPATNNNEVELFAEYIKLTKSSKLPVPNPTEVLANPEKYRKSISMINSMVQNNPAHPAYKYFSLLTKKIGLEATPEQPVEQPMEEPPTLVNQNLDQLLKTVDSDLANIKGNELNDNDTEDEA